MSQNRLVEKLSQLLGEQFVSTKLQDLQAASLDETAGLKPCLPDVLVKPGSAVDVQNIVLVCAKEKAPITCRGAGTGKSGGAVPVLGGVVMSFERMNRIIEIDRENLTARVGPGVILGEFQKTVEELGLFYPPDPQSASWCTIGGNVAENASGPNTLKYGSTRDYVLGLQIVLPTGEMMRVGKKTIKGVTGFDLPSLVCGSEGTLAIVTEITLKLLPKPAALKTAMIVFDSAEEACSAVSQILGCGILPRCIEYIDNKIQNKAGATLIIETDGESEESALGQLERLKLPLLIAHDEKQRREIWQMRKSLSEQTKKMRKFKISEDVVVLRTKLPELVAKLHALGEKYGLLTCAFGHAGDGNLHAQILFDDESERPKAESLIEELFKVTLSLGGTLTGEHGIGISKKPYLHLEQSEELIALQRRIKLAFDPGSILNPGKIF